MQSSTPSIFTARQIMTADVVSVRPDTPIEEAADLLEHHHVSGLPVVDDQDRVVGVLSEYDLLRCIAELEMRGCVADFMTSEVTTVGEDISLHELADLFLSTRMRRVPVTSHDGKLIGVIARRDLVFTGQMRQLMADLPVWDVPELDESQVGENGM